MKSKLLLCAYCICIFNAQTDAERISSKLEFGEDSKSSEFELIDDRKPIKRADVSKETIEDDEESVKFMKSDGKSEKLTDKDVVCNSNKCVVEIENGSNKRKTSTDIHVKISTKTEDDSKENEKPKIDVPDVPIIKGYAGVNPEDVKKDTEDNGVGINIPMDNPNIVYSRDSDSAMPSINLKPPKYHPTWQEYLDSKTTEKPKDFHPYLIGDKDHQNHIPQGWVSSGWKPMIPSFSHPDDYYHYNVNNKERGFSESMPHYFNYCTCTRKPVFQQRPSYSPHHRSGYPRRGHPWFNYETTPKTVIDDKLDGPFTKTKSRRYS